ncbi:MAG: hypothetical protein HY204_01000 [Nitrospirae bacterium]|nr:hypothetical protein [Nitrospirota bacterium]
MRRIGFFVVAVALLMGVASRPAHAANLGFDLGTSFYLPGEKTADSGTANSVAITFPLSPGLEVGFYREELSFGLEKNLNGGPKTRVNTDVSIDAIRIVQSLAGPIAIGLAVGTAGVTGTTGGATTISDRAPMADIFARVTALSGGDKINANLSVTLGYRLLRIAGVDPDGAGTDFTSNVSNLGGFGIGVSAGVRF